MIPDLYYLVDGKCPACGKTTALYSTRPNACVHWKPSVYCSPECEAEDAEKERKECLKKTA